MKNIIALLMLLFVCLYTSAQNNINNNGGSAPVSNPTLQSATSNSNNSNSGVNAQGNPGTISNANSNSSSGGFQTPAPDLQPGVKLNSGGNNAIIPEATERNSSGKIIRDSSLAPKPGNKINNPSNELPNLSSQEKTAHIDSMIRAIDRRQQSGVKRVIKKTKNSSTKKAGI